MRVYISGPLQGAGDLDSARRFYDALAVMVADLGHEAYVPHHFTDPESAGGMSANAVFTADIEALNRADAVIAHVGLPSTGVGAEIALASASGRRVLGVKRSSERGSRFAEGLISDTGGEVVAFGHQDELRSAVARWLSMPPAWFGSPSSIAPHRRVVA
ncbi:nucleoside 2-deoxyribosyltransferase [Microbacter sp. GSS18]|nr:nucleoside 2-deoxyribosyltransferase [Microbacter sp. GSS18]